MYTDLSIHETLNFQGAFLYNGGIRRLQRHGRWGQTRGKVSMNFK